MRREDLKDSSFLALIASLVGCAVAALPKRAWHHIRSQNPGSCPPNPVLFIERCHTVATQAREANYLDREIAPPDHMISYLIAMTGVFTSGWNRARIYLEQALTMSRMLGLSKCNGPHYTTVDGVAATTQLENGHDLQESLGPTNFLLQEMGRRIFWLIFIAVKRLQQLGMASEELTMLPAVNSRPYPPLPMEVDDRYIMEDRILPQPQGTISELAGFNAIVRLYLSYNKLSIFELADCVVEGPKEELRERLIKQSLHSIQQTVFDLPADLVIASGSRIDSPASQLIYPPPAQELIPAQQGNFSDGQYQELYAQRRRALLDMQKAEIKATELTSRMHIVKSYYFSSIINSQEPKKEGKPQVSEPASKDGAASDSDGLKQSKDNHNLMEKNMLNEQEEITKQFIGLLSSLNQFSVELAVGDFVSL